MKDLTRALSQKMNRSKRGISLSVGAMAGLLLGLTFHPQVINPAQANPRVFNDIQGNWARQCIEQLVQRNIMGEYSYGLFQPNLPMTRGDYAVMITTAFPKAPLKRMDETFSFIDLPSTYWATASIREAWLMGFVVGYPGNVFLPFQPISRLEVVLSLMAGLGYVPPIPEGMNNEIFVIDETQAQAEKERQLRVFRQLQRHFVDANEIPLYAREVILEAVKYGLIVNYPHSRQFRPNHPANRGEISAFLCQSLKTTGVVPSQYIVRE
jgi:hypothetical protein